MSALRVGEWHKLPVSLTELCINTTLRCGQSFRWRKSGEDEWSIGLHGRILSLRQDPESLHYRAIFPSNTAKGASDCLATTIRPTVHDEDNTRDLVTHYFNLGPKLNQFYEQWAAADPNFAKKGAKFTGIRILKQDAWEALVGFICSSNNNIARISQMVEKLCLNYGPLIGHLNDLPYHDFPSPKSLTHPKVEQQLRNLGFGYRAKYIWQTAVMITEREGNWLNELRNPESPLLGIQASFAGDWTTEGRAGYRKAHEELLALQGVGPKVADCVCLMGLGWGEAVPVDTHVWQIAQRDYKFGKGKHSSLTKATYDAVGNKFRTLWGKEAGWAHSVLFTADLRAFSERLVAKVETEEGLDPRKEESNSLSEELISHKTKVTKKMLKRLPEKDEHTILEIEDRVVSKTKRRKKS